MSEKSDREQKNRRSLLSKIVIVPVAAVAESRTTVELNLL
jgi:hypothetical protein